MLTKIAKGFKGLLKKAARVQFTGRGLEGTCPLHLFRRHYWTPPLFTVRKLMLYLKVATVSVIVEHGVSSLNIVRGHRS